MTDLLIYASFTALALVFLRAIWLSARFLVIIALTMIIAANADAWIAAALPWRDALAVYLQPALVVPLAVMAWAFGVGLVRTLWPLYVKAKRRAAHRSVDSAHDAMLS